MSHEVIRHIHCLEDVLQDTSDSNTIDALRAAIAALWKTHGKSGWEVLLANKSERNGGLYVVGLNWDAQSVIDREFRWHIGPASLPDSRFNFDGCKFAEGAEGQLERMRCIDRAK